MRTIRGLTSLLSPGGPLWSGMLLLLGGAVFDCATLEPIPPSTCGNAVIDTKTEDCDSFPANCGTPAEGTKACRYKCDSQVAGSCPTGWGCSVEGFCRQATGNLAPAGAPLSAGAASLISGDFDGDGRSDIVGAPPYKSSGGSRVHFFDGEANLATTTSLQVPLQVPVIKDFNHDGIEDLGFAITALGFGGFGAMAGRRDRTFSPILFPAITLPKLFGRPTTLDVTSSTFLPGFKRSCVIAAAQVESGNRLVSFCGDELEEELNVGIAVGPTDLVDDLKTGLINEPTVATICGEVVGGYNKAGQGILFIASPCDVVGSATDPVVRFNNAKKPVEVNTPGKLLQGPLLADISYPPDGLADIIVRTDQGLFVAMSSKSGLQPFVSLKTVAPFTTLTIDEMPLAAVDLNGDGHVDLVFPSGVLMSIVTSAKTDGGVPGVTMAPGLALRARSNQKWSDVRIGNFNSDQLPDLLVMYPDALDVELFGNAGDGLFTSFVVRSDQVVRGLVSGDFDGDLIQDVAFLQSPRKLDEPAGRSGEVDVDLVLAYGRTAGAPETPQVVGRFSNARAVTRLHDNQSAVDSLSVMEVFPQPDGALPTTTITVILGSGDRQAIAPLFMSDAYANPPYEAKGSGRKGKVRLWVPVSMTAGALSTVGTIDLLSIATGFAIDFDAQPPALLPSSPTGVWIASNDAAAPGGLGSFREVQRITDVIAGVDPEKVRNGVLEASVIAAAGDIDTPPDGLDEVITLSRTPLNDSVLYVVHGGGGGGAPSQPTGGGMPTVTKLDNVSVKGGDPIALADVNADGAPDLVTLTTVSKKRKVLALLNNGGGGLSPTPIEVPVPDAAGATSGDEDPPIAFAHFVSGVRTDKNKPQSTLAIITPKRLFLATLNADGATFDVQERTSLLNTDAKSPAAKLTSISAGDFNGDGVQDVAVADSGSIRILRQLPRIK